MSVTYRNLYSDETGIQSDPVFYFGAISCSPIRARILEESLRSIRNRHCLCAEMKWTKVSEFMLERYRDYVDIFLADPYSLHLMEVHRGPTWRGFGPNETVRFFKAYYVFLRRIMSLYSRYTVYVDDKPGKHHRWSQVKYAINAAVLRDHSLQRTLVRQLVPMDSKRSNLLQVVDVVLGAAVAQLTRNRAKLDLARHVREHLAQPRYLGNPKCERWVWSPSRPA